MLGSLAGFIIGVLGAGVVFTLGYQQFTEALGQFFQHPLQNLYQSPGKKPIQGLGAGIAAGVISGSGFPGIMTLLGFVNSGRVSPPRSIWLILGLYLGTLVPLWLLVALVFGLQAGPLGLGLLALGLVIQFNPGVHNYLTSGVVSGMGLAFLAAAILNGFLLLIPFEQQTSVLLQEAFQSPWSWVGAFFVGGLFVLLFRTPFTIWVVGFSLAYRGWIPLEVFWSLVLGSHGFFPLVSLSAARVLGVLPMRTSLAHLLLNWISLGIALGGSFLFWPGRVVAYGTPLVGAWLISFLYAIHGTVGSLVFVGAKKSLLNLGPEAGADTKNPKDLEVIRLVPDYMPDALSVNLSILREALARMAGWNHEMLMIVLNISQDTRWDEESSLVHRERVNQLASLGANIRTGITRLVQLPNSPSQAQTLARQQTTLEELLKIADSCAKILSIFERTQVKNYRFHSEGTDELFEFTAQVLDFLQYNRDFLAGKIDSPNWNLAKEMEAGIDKARDKLAKRSRKHLEKDSEAHIRGELLFIDLLGHLEHIGDSCLAIARAIFASQY
ncbi:MAG: hypothetical protein GW949_03740 [Spirochaetales bacterium]|nr:hypothetical protein [Spirochaetales bacterium]